MDYVRESNLNGGSTDGQQEATERLVASLVEAVVHSEMEFTVDTNIVDTNIAEEMAQVVREREALLDRDQDDEASKA